MKDSCNQRHSGCNGASSSSKHIWLVFKMQSKSRLPTVRRFPAYHRKTPSHILYHHQTFSADTKPAVGKWLLQPCMYWRSDSRLILKVDVHPGCRASLLTHCGWFAKTATATVFLIYHREHVSVCDYVSDVDDHTTTFQMLQASPYPLSKVFLLVNRIPRTGSKPNYCVKSHLSACWSGKNASSSIDLTAAPPSGSPLHHPNHPLSTGSAGARDPNWICPNKMTQIIPTIAPTICSRTRRLRKDFLTFK